MPQQYGSTELSASGESASDGSVANAVERVAAPEGLSADVAQVPEPGLEYQDDRPTLSTAQAQACQSYFAENLERSLTGLREAIATAPPPETLTELFEDFSRRANLRKYEVLLRQAHEGNVRPVWAPGPLPGEAQGKLYVIVSGFTTQDGRGVGALGYVSPGDDAKLDDLARRCNELAKAVAEEAAGRFNNLPYLDRVARTKRIVEIQALLAKAASGHGVELRQELVSLGLHDWVVLDVDRCMLTVAPEIQQASW